MYEVYLAHHGILGQKWGVRRYQNPDGSLTAAGRKRYAIDSDGKIRKLSSSERRAAVKMEKNRAAALEKARKARVEKAEYNKQKVEAIKSGDASKIEKYFNDLTPVEMQDAMNRINTKQNFQRMLNNEAQLVSNGKSKTDQLMDKVGKVSNYAETGIRFYNIIAKVNNAFNEESYMPSIGGEWAGDRKKKLAKEAKEEAEAAEAKKKAKKEEKERKEVEKLISSADEYTLYMNRDKFQAKDWTTISARMKAEDTLFENMSNKKIGEIQIRQNEHKNLADDYAKLAKEIPTAYQIRADARKSYNEYMLSNVDKHQDLSTNYRTQSVNIWKNSKASQDTFNKVANQYTKEEQEEIKRARGWK